MDSIDLKAFIIMALMGFLLICIIKGCYGNIKETEIKSYDLIVIDGKEYDTDQIESVTQTWGEVDEGYRIVFTDGTEIICQQYTLKNRGENE